MLEMCILKNWKIILAVLTVNVVMMAAGYTMLIPFLPMYLINELGVNAADVKLWNGAIFSITFLIGGIMGPIWGRIADSRGKKIMAIRAGAGLAISYFLGGLVVTPEQLFGVRVLQGFAAGLWSACLAIATSLVPNEKLGVSLGIMQAGLTGGNVIGPLVGGALATAFGMRVSFFVAGSLLIVITLIFMFYIPEPPKADISEKAKFTLQKEDLLKQPIIRETLIYTAVVQLVILLIQPVLSLYVEELNHGEGNIIFLSGVAFSLIGIASAVTAPSWGHFGQVHGFYRALCAASLLSGIMSCIVALPQTLLLFCICNFCYGLCCAGIQPSLSAILASNTEANQRGRVFGFMFSAQQFGSMVGPLLGGFIATYAPLKSLFITAGIVLLCISSSVWLRHGKE